MIDCTCELCETDIISVDEYVFGYNYYVPEVMHSRPTHMVVCCTDCKKVLDCAIKGAIADIKADARRV